MVRLGRLLLLVVIALSQAGCAFDRAPVTADASQREPNWACRVLHRPAAGGFDGRAPTTYGNPQNGAGVLVALVLIPVLAGTCAVSRL